MKKFSKLALLLLAGALVFFSCDLLSSNGGDDTENPGNGNKNDNGNGNNASGVDFENHLSGFSIK
jgi:hypothetical protein